MQANTGFFGEIASFEKHGVVFDLVEDSLLGVWEDVCEKYQLIEGSAEWKQEGLRRVSGREPVLLALGQYSRSVRRSGPRMCRECTSCGARRRGTSAHSLRSGADAGGGQLAEDYDMWPITTCGSISAGLAGPNGPTEEGIRRMMKGGQIF